MADIPIGVVTISDRASRGVYEDKGGPGIEAALRELLATPWRPVRRIAGLADQVSQGEMSAPQFPQRGAAEIVSLTRSFERMRKSLEKALRLLGT